MTKAERLAAILPIELIEVLEDVLARVDHAGRTRVELGHDPSGRIVDFEVAPASRRGRVGRRTADGGAR